MLMPKVIKTESKVKIVQPSSGKFWLIPVFSPHLREFIETLNWNCVEQTLNLDIRETRLGTALKWFSGINKRYDDSQKTILDLEKDSIVLIVLDDEENELLRYRFGTLRLVGHSCAWSTFPDTGTLRHNITVRYQTVEEIVKEKWENISEINRNDIDPYQVIDDEWQVKKDYKTAEEATSKEESSETENT